MLSFGSAGQRSELFDELERVAPFLFSLLENIPDIVCMISGDGVVHFVNRAQPDRAPLEMVGESIYDYLAPESHEAARACFARVVETGSPGFFEAAGFCAHGEAARYETRVGPVQHGGRVVALTLIASDITQRVEMDRRLRDSRDALEFAIAATGLGLWHVDVETRELVWDEGTLRIYGRTVAPRDYRAGLDAVHPDDRAAVDAGVRESLSTGAFQDLEYRIIRPDGGLVWVLARGKALRDASGRVTRLLGGVIDITARKRIEEALQLSEARYRTSIAALEEGIVLQDSEGTIHTCNASAERLLGLTQAQMCGRTSLDPRWRSVHEDGSPFPGDTHPSTVTLRSGEPQSGVIMGVYKPAGELTWISVNSRPLFLSGPAAPSAVVTSFFDITERKRAEAENARLLAEERAARSRADLLAETSKLLASSLDVVTALEEVVRRWVANGTDLAIVELLDEWGEFGPAHAIVVAADDATIEAPYLELRRRTQSEQCSLSEIVRGGAVRFTAGRGDGVPDPLPGISSDEALAERMRYRSTVLIPLTARAEPLGLLVLAARTRTFGADDLALAEELGLRIAQALDVTRLYGEMQTSLQKRDEFIAVASHELRTPLTPVVLQLGRLLQQTRRSDALASAEVEPKLQRMLRQIDRMQRLIEELLDVSQITRGHLHLELEDLDLVALVRETVDGFADNLARAGCPLHVEMPPELRGRWDRTRIEQIIGNLLCNAMKYGAAQPIDVIVREEDEDQVSLSVVDRGIGISLQDQARVFQRFERAVSERHYGGFGLGLWITRHVVEAMGGTISLTSTPGVGSTFCACIPRHGPPAATT
ncbi:PAS domain S-box protein [Nannocystis sp. SCPEA4]|uniref:PAS domain S-box protein n=1 Tax=Nannocystis sp. SCPEA4 TaxID=2996787 RepID=UPI00226D815D|nr:PAS domain S-box protein [Nannocystis sp. SCPEA4]